MMTMFEMPYGYSESTDQLCRDTSKELFDLNANCKDPDQPAEIYRLIRNFSYLIMFYSTRWFYKWTVKVQIRLRGCAVWSGPTLSAYVRRRVFAWRPSAKSLELVTTRADYRVMHIQRIARNVKKYWPLIRGFWHARLRTYSWAGAQHFLQDCMCTQRRLRFACAFAQSDQWAFVGHFVGNQGFKASSGRQRRLISLRSHTQTEEETS